VTWTQQNAYSGWQSVASSADGTRLVAVAGYPQSLYTSIDSGATWTAQSNGIPNGNFWGSVASSADGTRLAAAANPGAIYTSTNSGATWTAQTNGLPNGGTNSWISIASSADGTKLVVAPGSPPGYSVGGPKGPIYTSTNSGATWTAALVAFGQIWTSVASSADGTKLAAVSQEGSSPNSGLYISANSGVSWNNFLTQGNFNLSQITMSADGTTVLASALNYETGFNPPSGFLEVSTNSGQTWALVTIGTSNINRTSAKSIPCFLRLA